jgi:hypothetical protein
LENLLSVWGDLIIDSNESLESLAGLEGVAMIGQKLDIFYNNTLSSLDGLTGLTSIGGDLQIELNDELTDLTALEGVTSIGGNLKVSGNNSLGSLSGIGNIDPGSISGIHISANPLLSICDVLSVCAFLANPTGGIIISWNAPGCNSKEEIEEACESHCLPGGITFTTQAEIDDFQVNHPNCNQIDGPVTISGSDIVNLAGLEVITTIGDELNIPGNEMLTSLEGLENLTSIGGRLQIDGNPSLTNLSGLDNIDPGSIGDILISGNQSLSGCDVQSICSYLGDPNGTVDIYDNGEGCDNPAEVAGSCGVTIPCLPYGNYHFTTQADIDNFQSYYPGCDELHGDVSIQGADIDNLQGLNAITAIGGNLHIGGNPALANMEGLEGLTSIGGGLQIFSNSMVASLIGLENIAASSIDSLYIVDNDLLSACHVQSICDYLVAPGGTTQISNNAPGCENIGEVLNSCDITCLPQGITFTDQAQIDSFQEDYPGCNEIEGSVGIIGDDISNLEGLDPITSIDGMLTISSNSLLTGLNGLQNLTAISGALFIDSNASLISLNGLENIEAGSISQLFIHNNPLLSECHVQSVCDYLTGQPGPMQISGNAPGCSNLQEVLEGCETVDIKDHGLLTFSIRPNPSVQGTITLTVDNPHNLQLSLFNPFGQQMHQQEITDKQTLLDVSTWAPGIYLAVAVEDGRPVGRSKFLIQ